MDDLYVYLFIVVVFFAIPLALRYLLIGAYHGLVAAGWVHPAEPELFYRRATRTRVDGAVDGKLVRLYGALRVDPSGVQPIVAPFSGRPCLYCETLLEQYHHDPDSDRAYDPRLSRVQGLDWVVLEDASGSARVRLHDARSQLQVVLDGDRDLIMEGVPIDQVEQFLVANRSSFASIDEGFPWGNSRLPGDYRIRQQLICEGDEVLVCGRCHTRPGAMGAAPAGAGAYREAPRQTVIDVPGDRKRTPILVTNDKKLLRSLNS